MDFSNVSKAVEKQKPEVVAKKSVVAQGKDTAVAGKAKKEDVKAEVKPPVKEAKATSAKPEMKEKEAGKSAVSQPVAVTAY
jgi:hypothetical protein